MKVSIITATYNSSKTIADTLQSLNTQSYENILNNNGFGIDENRVAIETVEHIRNATILLKTENMHSLIIK